LKLLVSRLTQDFDVYIHADAKWDLKVSNFDNFKNVKFVNRFNVNWGSYNQILATIELFKQANAKHYDYYILISGQDLPIKSNVYIKEAILSNPKCSYVNGELLPRSGWEDQEGGFKRVHYYWGADFRKNIFGILSSKFLGVIRFLQYKYNFKRSLYPIPYYGGWNWVNLSQEAMQYVIHFLDENPDYIRTFKYSLTADELWLQTILFNSSLPVINDNLRFTDWPKYTPHPKILLTEDFQPIYSSKDWFGRKFDVNVDKEIVLKIYNITRNKDELAAI
jgi:hypothetical protein